MFKRAVFISAVFFLFGEGVALRMEVDLPDDGELFQACRGGDEEIVRMLLAAGAIVTTASVERARDRGHDAIHTLLQNTLELLEMAEQNNYDADKVQELLQNGGSVMACDPETNKSTLTRAFEHGNFDFANQCFRHALASGLFENRFVLLKVLKELFPIEAFRSFAMMNMVCDQNFSLPVKNEQHNIDNSCRPLMQMMTIPDDIRRNVQFLQKILGQNQEIMSADLLDFWKPFLATQYNEVALCNIFVVQHFCLFFNFLSFLFLLRNIC